MRPVAVPADRRFRRAHVKPARKGRVPLRQAWLALRLAIVLGLTLYGGWHATALVLGAPALQVSRVAIEGNERLSQGEILALLEGLHGTNIVTIDLDHWQQRLLASPWVEEAHVRRVLPAGVEVEVRERRPVGIGRLFGSLYLFDADGVVLDEHGPRYADLDLPMVDGLAMPAASDGTVVDPERARLAARVIAALDVQPEVARRVALIDVSDVHDAHVMLDGDTATLRVGRDEFVERIQEYLEMAPALRERVPNIDYVDLRFDDRMYVRPQGGRRR